LSKTGAGTGAVKSGNVQRRSAPFVALSRPASRAVLPSDENVTPRTAPVEPVKRPTSRRVSTSHSRAVLSSPPERTQRPSGEKATPATVFVWPWKLPSSARLFESSRWTVLSAPPPISLFQSRDTARECRAPGAVHLPTSLPAPTSQRRTVWSRLADRTCLSSGWNATAQTGFWCPPSALISVPFSRSQTRTMLSEPPETPRLPSREKATL